MGLTQAARNVLDDCRIALSLLEEEVDLQRWRVHWAGAVALTRAVGHVLDKVDGSQNPKIKKAAALAFKGWKGNDPEHAIFREFIDLERNNILKEYRFSHHPLAEVDVEVVCRVQNQLTGHIADAVSVFPIGDNIYRPMLDGFREGDDARDVLSDALDWGDCELMKLDLAVVD